MRKLLLGGGAYARSFPSGTLMLFQQTTAPLGWTKQTTHDDKALRVVTGSASSGGASAFTSVFGSGKTTGSTTLTTSHLPASGLSIPSLTVNITSDATTPGSSTGLLDPTASSALLRTTNQVAGAGNLAGVGTTDSSTTGNMGTGGGHTHTESLDLHYVDVIIAQKV
jgi:hypothetical protein